MLGRSNNYRHNKQFENMEDPKAVFKEYCRRNGMRYTPERDGIIDVIFQEKDKFDIDELSLHIRVRYPETKLAKASIYRTIPYLLKIGLIKEIFCQKSGNNRTE